MWVFFLFLIDFVDKLLFDKEVVFVVAFVGFEVVELLVDEGCFFVVREFVVDSLLYDVEKL